MRKILFESLLRRPLTEPPPAGRGRAGGARDPRRSRGAPPARPQPVDPRGRRRLVQRLRAGDPRAQQRVLRPRALRPALRRLAAPCRRADGDRAGHQEHARGARAHLRRDARPEMGGRGRRLRARRRHLRGQLRGGRRRRGGGAGRSPHPRLPAASGAIAQGSAGAARGTRSRLDRSADPASSGKRMEPHRLLPGQFFPAPLAQLANHRLAALSDATCASARRAKALIRRRLLLVYRQSSSKCHFQFLAWKAHDGRKGALNTDAAPLIFRSDTSAGSTKSSPAFRQLGTKGRSDREGPGNLEIFRLI